MARRHCVKRRGERQYVAKTRHERRDERRDGAKRKVSEGSSLRLALVAAPGRATVSLRPGMNAGTSDRMERSGRFRRAAACAWRWWQRPVDAACAGDGGKRLQASKTAEGRQQKAAGEQDSKRQTTKGYRRARRQKADNKRLPACKKAASYRRARRQEASGESGDRLRQKARRATRRGLCRRGGRRRRGCPRRGRRGWCR